MAVIDRNILRLGVYELVEQGDVPRGAVINEAVELAKKYSTASSGAFVNGILDQVAERGAAGKGSASCRLRGGPAPEKTG
ncbi:transcription antitermination protein NusB [Planctomycetota bacterium]